MIAYRVAPWLLYLHATVDTMHLRKTLRCPNIAKMEMYVTHYDILCIISVMFVMCVILKALCCVGYTQLFVNTSIVPGHASFYEHYVSLPHLLFFIIFIYYYILNSSISLQKMFSPYGHPFYFFIRTDLEKCSIISLAHQWIPLQWMGAVRVRVQTADKPLNHRF